MNTPLEQYIGATVTTNLVPVVVALGATVSARRARGRGDEPRETWTRWWSAGSGVGAVLVALSFVAIPRTMADSMGYAHTPFQFEVAMANLGFAVGLLAGVRRREVRAVVAVGFAVFMWGALGGHVFQLVANGDHTAGNVPGIWIYDLVMPLVLLALVLPRRRSDSSPLAAGPLASNPSS